MKVYAFIVTYNRFEPLKRVVDCLRNQEYPIDKIIVVNNSSTDGLTKPWLETQKDLKVITQANLGGAGGFYTGIKYCYDTGADWIWMMDDDVFPDPNCLKELMKYKSISHCLQVTRYYSDGVLVPFPAWSMRPDYRNNLFFNENSVHLYVKCPNGICFEGTLLSKYLVEEVGCPDKDFFISGDDTIYGCIIAKTFCVPIQVKTAIAYRQRSSTDKDNRTFYTYYSVRNRHLKKKYKTKYDLHNVHIDSCFHYYFILPLHILSILIKGGDNKYKEIRALYFGILDGFKKEIGPSHLLRKF